MDSDRGRQFRALAQTMKEQAEGLVPREQELQAAFATYENECRSGMLSGMTSLEIATLRSVIEDYRRWKCLPDASPPPVVASEEPSAPVVNAAPVRPAGLRWFEV
ncbi:MAG: hypothetical protein HC882_08490, partial [Acidobacteria bacterium]|nr:hypothetical protein [Acidobacteriota bacterium]